jgi:hypothetical protein
MRTTLDLPDGLIQEALMATNAKNRTQVIIMALEELIRRHRISEIKRYKGKLDLNIDLATVRDRAGAC